MEDELMSKTAAAKKGEIPPQVVLFDPKSGELSIKPKSECSRTSGESGYTVDFKQGDKQAIEIFEEESFM